MPYTLLLLLFQKIVLPILCQSSTLPDFVFYYDDDILSWYDRYGNTSMIGEPMTRYLTLNTSFISWNATNSSRKVGDIVPNWLNTSRKALMESLSSAYLEPTVYSDSSGFDIRYIRNLSAPSGIHLGFMYAEPPDPDPQSLFDAWNDDSKLAGVPTGLRSEVNPAALIPTPTAGCPRLASCFLVIPVGTIKLHIIVDLTLNNVLVCRCLLFWPGSYKYSLFG